MDSTCLDSSEVALNLLLVISLETVHRFADVYRETVEAVRCSRINRARSESWLIENDRIVAWSGAGCIGGLRTSYSMAPANAAANH